MNEERSRAVFSINDYDLIKEALLHYITDRSVDEDEQKIQTMLHLYHRLGRIS